MTNEERDLIARYIARVAGAGQGGGFTGGSVPQSSQPGAQPLPPIDREADAFIAQQFQQYPDARYRITQTALVQEGALAESQNQIRRLQWELDQTRHAMQNQPQQSPQQKGFFSSLFGGGAPQPQGRPGYGQAFQPTSPPPQPQYPPGYQPGMFGRGAGGGSGFLGSALTTAAGVAGGMVVGNALMGAFSGNHGGGGLFGSGTDAASAGGSPWDGAGVSPVNDTSGGFLGGAAAGGADPFGGSGTDPFAGGGAEKDSGGGGGFSQDASYDAGGGDPFGGAGDSGGGGGFDGGGFDSGGFDQA